MRSPVSGEALGECNAIRNRGFAHGELTFVDTLKPRAPFPYTMGCGPSRKSADPADARETGG